MDFWKMNGAGNDFLILNGIRERIRPETMNKTVPVLCERHLSIGADGVMLVLPAESPEADYRMLFYNSDGSMGEMCGNGARCICRYGFETGLAGKIQRVETTAGLVTGERIDQRNYRIRLNDPTTVKTGMEVNVNGTVYPVSYVELGTPGLPHAVLPLPEEYRRAAEDLISGRKENRQELAQLRELGRSLRHAGEFPKGANVNFFFPAGDETYIITFERGVEDFTYACGTGTGSVALILKAKGLSDGRNVKVRNRGGLLTVDVKEDGLYLTGPTNIVATGTVRDEAL